MTEEDQDSLFGSPPPSPRISPQFSVLSLPSASICDNNRRLSTSTDTQNVGTIALPGSHPFSELPINPLALSLNHTTVHRPPAGQPVPTAAEQQIQPCQQSRPAQIRSKGSEKSRQSSQTSVSSVPSRDSEFSLPDPLAPPPAHFLRNQQNLLGNAGLVAGVKPSTITHIRGASSFNPIVIDDEDEDAPLLSRRSQSGETRFRQVNPGLLTAPTNEDIISVLIGQKEIFPVLKGILSLIAKEPTQRTPTTPFKSRGNSLNNPPSKKRKLDRVPAGAADWDVPYPFQEGDGPDEYHKTWERERPKHLIAQLVKLVKMAARKAATKNYLQKEEARQAAWEKLQQEMMGSEPIVKKDVTVNNHYKPHTMTYGLSSDDQNLFDTWMSFLQAFPVDFDAQSQSQSTSQSSTPCVDDYAFANTMANNFDFGADFFMGVGGDGGQGVFRHTLWDNFGQVAYRDSTEGGGWDEMGQITRDSLTDEGNVTPMVGKEKAVLGTRFSSADATTPTQTPYSTLMGTQSTDIVLSPYEQQATIPEAQPSSADATTPTQALYNTLMRTQSTDIVPSPYEQQATIPEAQPPKNTISQSRKEEILRRAREKKRQVQEELDGVKTQLWETTIEQAALVHLLKRFDNVNDVAE